MYMLHTGLNASKRNGENKIRLKLQLQQHQRRRDQGLAGRGNWCQGHVETRHRASELEGLRKWNVEGGKQPKKGQGEHAKLQRGPGAARMAWTRKARVPNEYQKRPTTSQ
jgi:hypothetical protein